MTSAPPAGHSMSRKLGTRRDRRRVGITAAQAAVCVSRRLRPTLRPRRPGRWSGYYAQTTVRKVDSVGNCHAISQLLLGSR
jgi:hypothetical protein